jgi:copper homeostasis protein
MGVTFHREFDLTRDPLASVKDVIALGCERVLTSSQQGSAVEGAILIRALVEQSRERIIVISGAVITADNVVELAKLTGTREFHASAKTT